MDINDLVFDEISVFISVILHRGVRNLFFHTLNDLTISSGVVS